MAIYSMDNTIQGYDWGSPTTLPLFLGKENPSGEPWAELWMGAHPKAPSMVTDPLSGEKKALNRLIAEDPMMILGAPTAKQFGGTLPFLFKILCAAKPLSIQAHPFKQKAAHGFSREESAGIPLDAPERNYKDANHKPETVIALSRFEGMCGFRRIDQIVGNIKALYPNGWEHIAGRMASEPDRVELSVFFYTFLTLESEAKAKRLRYARSKCERIVSDEPLGSELRAACLWVLRLMETYPDDIGALAPLVFNLFTLEPGQALNLAPGEPHAYLEGMAAEIMANSDNVLRGGLTSKHVDIQEFVSTLSFDCLDLDIMKPEPLENRFTAYRVNVPDYAIAKAIVSGRLTQPDRAQAPEILLCIDGTVEIVNKTGTRVTLSRGTSVFLSADEPGYELSGSGTVFKAGVPT